MDIKEINVGDVLWFGLVNEAKVQQGEVLQLHPDDDLEPCATIMCYAGGYRVIRARLLAEDKKEAQKIWKELRPTIERHKKK